MKSFDGLFSALLTPVRHDGKIDFDQVSQLINLVLGAGINGICIGGATSEFPHFDVSQRKELVSFAAQKLNGRGNLITAIGASSYFQALELGRHAGEAGSDALMLPMPYFFPHEQDDLICYCRQLARELNFPVLIYHLPQFTQELALEATLELIASEKNIVGIKDSSGNPDNQEFLSRARSGRDFSLLVGNDSLVLGSLRSGWDGVISGVSSCCPELLVALFRSVRSGNLTAAEEYNVLLQELITRVSQLPFPWGLKSVLEARGIRSGPRSLPQSDQRQSQDKELKEWVTRWFERMSEAI